MNKRILSCALVILMLLVSCSNNDLSTDTQTTSASSEAGETERLYPKYDKTFDGKTVRILSHDNSAAFSWQNLVNDIDVESLDGTLLNDAVYERNSMIESMLDVVIEGIPSAVGDWSGKTFAEDVSKDVMSNDGYYDFITPSMAGSLALLIQGSNLLDLKQVSGLDLDAPWWNKECTESLELFGKLYGAASDMIYQDKLATIVTFYNKSIIEDFGMNDPTESALDGSWTFDKMLEYSNGIYSDINLDGAVDAGDRFGIICQNDFAGFMLNSFGIPLIENNDDLSLNSGESFVNSLIKVYEVMNDSEMFFNAHVFKVSSGDTYINFAENRGLFLIRPTHTLFTLRDMEADFGILPTPKADESQENYASPMNTSAAVTIAIPKSSRDLECTAAVIETLSAESMYELIPILYEDILGNKLLRDEVSAEILDTVYASRFYDVGSIFNLGGWCNTVYTSSAKGVASLIAENESAVEGAIDELRDTVLEN